MVGFRADLDALPIDELTDVPFRSGTPGVMHACGHDAHTAIAAYTAIALHRLGLDDGTVRFIFQPAEETPTGGAFDLVREGAIDGLTSLIAFHVDPTNPAGTVGLKPGPITASADRFEISAFGPGGHTARPHDTVDVITAMARIVTEVPAAIGRLVDARRPLALVFGQISGGVADNVIPTRVTASGTSRTLDRGLWDELPSIVERLAQEIAAPYGAKTEVHYTRGVPPVVNDETVIDHLSAAYLSSFGHTRVFPAAASMGAEDFSRFLEKVPGALVRLGVGLDGLDLDLHSASFNMDESAIEFGITAACVALIRLLDAA